MLSKIVTLLTKKIAAPWMPGSPISGSARTHRHNFAGSLIIGTVTYISLVLLVATFFLPLEQHGATVIRILFAFIATGAALSIYLLKGMRQRIISINVFLAFLGMGLIYFSFMTGGVLSPVSICLLIIPAVATLSIDSLAGKIWGCLAVITWLLLFYAQHLGLEVQRSIPGIDASAAFLFCLITVHLFLAYVTLHYESTSKLLRDNLVKERTEYQFLANHDTHTGMVNRRHFVELLRRAIDQCNLNGGGFCLYFIDLDQFKAANDNYGHHFGDKVLEIFADRLHHRTRKTDTTARIGGDEFCVLTMGIQTEDEAQGGLKRFEGIFQDPLKLEETTYLLRASIGYAIYPLHATDYESLLKHADHHMYQIKRSNRAASGIG